MSDRYVNFVNSSFGATLAKSVGLPSPTHLDRYAHGVDFINGDILVGAAPGFTSLDNALATIGQSTGKIFINCDKETKRFVKNDEIKAFDAGVYQPNQVKALVFDATGIKSSEELNHLYYFFHENIRKVANCGRIVILAKAVGSCNDTKQSTAQRAILGFVKSLGKEIGRGGTVNVIYTEDDPGNELTSTLRFLLSARSAYVSAQAVTLSHAKIKTLPASWETPLEGQTVLVTGAARGIGEAIANIMARQGATVVGLDIPPAKEDLEAVMKRIDGHAILADITQNDAANIIIDSLSNLGLSLDVLVHNAGITRDKTIAKMPDTWWTQTLDINLSSVERVNDILLQEKLIKKGVRIVCVSSMNGIAGARGQTNYATSKAGIIGMVESMAPLLGKKGITINAVAPGFIETEMTAKMPFAMREAGRRLNSMAQGGLPEDVAETIAWFANPASAGVNGNIVRVCGQNILGA